jgi:hypothetical protein
VAEEEARKGMGQLADSISKKGVDHDIMQIQTPFIKKSCGIRAETQVTPPYLWMLEEHNNQ